MSYNELIKNFNRIRAYLRSFYVYGFQHRDEFTQKSARSYDNERRRVESWLGDYMSFGQDEDGKRVFLSVDSRSIPENPLYRAFKTKSFTDRDITLHFHILDILRVTDGLSITGMMDELTRRLSEFDTDELPDESTVRKKLREYAALGLVAIEKRGRQTFYVLSEDHVDISTWDATAAFFSEASPLGVAGSFLQDRMPEKFQQFRFKHHYILNALDNEILYELFSAIGDHRLITFTARRQQITALPLKVYIGTQTGRQYLLAWSPANGHFSFYRADLMDNVKAGDRISLPADLVDRLADFRSHAWGVAANHDARLEHIEMTVFVGPDEGHIVERLEREKRCGRVEQTDETHWRYTADVYDALEMLPWLRTFTGRVTGLQCTDQRVINRFWKDFDDLAQMYGGGNDAVS
ncbi:MAG: WYL domain-containing protein [Blautia sp.]|nr:WYL domain-containing protein [Blautia sp.]